MKKLLLLLILILPLLSNIYSQSNGFIKKFELKKSNILLSRVAQPTQYFDKIGRKAALMGFEDGSFEMWVWPWKPLRNFEILFFLGSSTTPIKAKDIVRTIDVTPEATTLTFAYESFTVKEIIIVPVEERGALILLDVFTTEPLTIVPSFIPVMQPQWPAGIGGQYSYWDNDVKAYVISEGQQRAIFLCGSPLGKMMTAPPAHMFADNPLQFKIEIQPGESNNHFIPIVIAGVLGEKYDSLKTYYNSIQQNAEKLYERNYKHYSDFLTSTLNIITPVEKLNLAFQWGKIMLHNLMVYNQNLGNGMVAGYGLSGSGGRPGFSWFFGGDAFINSLPMISFQDFSTVKDALKFTQKWQRQDNFPIRKKSPDDLNKNIGKMAHELSQSEGLVDWWNDYHYGYNHADTTPWYLVSIGDYYRHSADLQFIKESWNSIKQAYDWCLRKDSDNDGLMDLKGAGLGALEFGKYVHMYADMYTSSIWTQAIKEVLNMSEAVGDKELQTQTKDQLNKALSSLEEKFWMDKTGLYSHAASEDGQQVEEKTPWSSIAMKWGLLSKEHTLKCLESYNDNNLCTDWGIRSLSTDSELFDPVNYNYGAVWPFISSLFGTAQFKYNFNLSGYNTLLSTIQHMFDYGLGVMPEVFSGRINYKLAEAYHDQGFSATGFMEPLLRGLLGIELDAPNNTIIFEPHIPADWTKVEIGSLLINRDNITITYQNEISGKQLIINNVGEDTLKLLFQPSFGPEKKLIDMKAYFDSKKEGDLQKELRHIRYEQIEDSQSSVYKFQLDIPPGETTLNIGLNNIPEIYLISTDGAEYGQTNRGLKIISQEFEKNKLITTVEGLGNISYQLGVVGEKYIKKLDGAELDNGLKFTIPGKDNDKFYKHNIIIEFKD
ncbi:MAG: hypothetical protein A2V93_07165 [Ignavibacteria bacterium RBG_16_34_14]|nr:MAG: hypothetical protein A2V93_07165 [Ignavibacteria bacterium RBG_16_34_14]